MKHFLTTYSYGIAMFIVSILIALAVFKDYGISWDENAQRNIGYANYNYVFKGDKMLFSNSDRFYGVAFEVPLILLEKGLRLKNLKEIFYMRHLVTHLFYLFGCLCIYIIIFRLYGNQFLAVFGFFALVTMPRIYAHSFFNTKDIPLLTMFIITFLLAQFALEKQKTIRIILLGASCGFTAGIRIGGIILVCFLSIFFLSNIIYSLSQKKKANQQIQIFLIFLLSFCSAIFIVWPLIWNNPIQNFLDTLITMSHNTKAGGTMLLNGQLITPANLPISYFPIWFCVTIPILFLLIGIAGIVVFVAMIVKSPKYCLKNKIYKNNLLYFFCFVTPILLAIFLHSPLYDDWRHLYFIYPSFVLLGVYLLSRLMSSKFRWIIQSLCFLQIAIVAVFMIQNHPFQQVYFNSTVSHKNEYLRKNYELDYWGVSFKQGLEFLASNDNSPKITLCKQFISCVIADNLLMLNQKDRTRFEFVDEENHPDYLMTNYRYHPADYTYPKIYEIKALNSTILAIYKLK